jgi:hypothetical protein
MRLRTLFVIGTAVASAACGSDASRDETPADTFAVPPGAVDTTTLMSDSASVSTGAPGAGTAQSGAEKATGVDTPITRRLQAKEAARDSADTTKRPD